MITTIRELIESLEHFIDGPEDRDKPVMVYDTYSGQYRSPKVERRKTKEEQLNVYGTVITITVSGDGKEIVSIE